MNKPKIALYESEDRKALQNNAKWFFEPVSFERLAWLLDFMLHEEREDEREVRMTALLAGEVVCTNLSAFKLVRFDEEVNEMRKVSKDEARNIIDTREPLGLFYLEENGKFVGIDNTTGDAWTEEFDDKATCFHWLSGKIEIGDGEDE